MLNTLRKIEKNQRGAVLSSIAARLAPSPFDLDELDHDERLVLDELGKKFGFDGVDVPSRLRPAVYRALQGEIKDVLLDRGDLANVRDRVGQKGLLATELYDVRFTPAFLDMSAPMGISKDLARRTVVHAEGVEHLFPEEAGLLGLDAQSLFFRDHPLIRNCSVLVIAFRKNAQLTIDAAWLVFHDLVGSSDVNKPSLMLQQFVEHYGEAMQIGDLHAKFVIQTSVKTELWGAPRNLISSNFEEPHDVRFSVRSAHGEAQIGLAYAICLRPYLRDVALKGVAYTRTLPPAGPGTLLVQTSAPPFVDLRQG